MYFLLRYYKEETQLVGLFFIKGVLEFVVKVLDKYTYVQRNSKNSFLKLKLSIWGYQQVTTDAFTFPEEILKRDTSLFWVLAVSKEMK